MIRKKKEQTFAEWFEGWEKHIKKTKLRDEENFEVEKKSYRRCST